MSALALPDASGSVGLLCDAWGTWLPDEARFCANCGRPQPMAGPSPVPLARLEWDAAPTAPLVLPAAPAHGALPRTAGFVGVACAAAVCVGSLGPWVTITAAFVGSLDVRGIQGDGNLTLAGGVAAGLLLALLCAAPRRAWLGALAALAFGAVAAVGAYD